MNSEPSAPPMDIETTLDDSFYMMNTGHVTVDNISNNSNNLSTKNLTTNSNKKLVYLLLGLLVCSIGFIIYDHNTDIMYGLSKFGDLFS
jgi:hypothetical protein